MQTDAGVVQPVVEMTHEMWLAEYELVKAQVAAVAVEGMLPSWRMINRYKLAQRGALIAHAGE